MFLNVVIAPGGFEFGMRKTFLASCTSLRLELQRLTSFCGAKVKLTRPLDDGAIKDWEFRMFLKLFVFYSRQESAKAGGNKLTNT